MERNHLAKTLGVLVLVLGVGETNAGNAIAPLHEILESINYHVWDPILCGNRAFLVLD